MVRKFAAVLTALGMASVPAPVLAWDGITTGKVGAVDVVTNGDNFGFRIYMSDKPMYGTNEAWAYINRSENNYDAMVSLLTAAYLNGRTITIYTSRNGAYCAIGYATFR